jgi:hypothetical protein
MTIISARYRAEDDEPVTSAKEEETVKAVPAPAPSQWLRNLAVTEKKTSYDGKVVSFGRKKTVPAATGCPATRLKRLFLATGSRA